MKNKRKFLLLVIVGLMAAGFYGVHEFSRANPDMTDIKESYQADANGLLSEFNTNEITATKKYLGKVVAVTGTIKEIEKDEKGFYTVVLGISGNMNSVRCLVDQTKSNIVGDLQKNKPVTIKGNFTGYNADATGLLGSDVQMNRCVIKIKN
ncbi:MAG: hypothetical protein JST75_19445 [Bacteroidetes bacterium]|nr:hypothetical protein [Bacteroidota bacterium]